MPTREEQWEYLIEALRAYPCVELIPKNILSELVHVSDIDISPTAQEEITRAHDIERDLGLLNEAVPEVDIANLVNEFEDTRLGEIIFRKPIHCSDRITNESIDLELLELEQKIYDNVSEEFSNKIIEKNAHRLSEEDIISIVDPGSFHLVAQEYLRSINYEEDTKTIEKRQIPQNTTHTKRRKAQLSAQSSVNVKVLQNLMNDLDYKWEKFSQHHQETLELLSKVENQVHRVCRESAADHISDTSLKSFTSKCRDIIYDHRYVNWAGFKKGTVAEASDLNRQYGLIKSIMICFEILLCLALSCNNGTIIFHEEILTDLIDFINNIFTNIILGCCTSPKDSLVIDTSLFRVIVVEAVKRTIDLLHLLPSFIDKYPMEHLIGLIPNLNMCLSIHSVSEYVSKGVISSLKAQSMNLMVKLSQMIPNSRAYIIHEVLQDAYKASPTKSKLNSFTISSGKHISMVSALLLQICQRVDLKDARILYKNIDHTTALLDRQILSIGKSIEKQALLVDSLAREICVYLIAELTESSDKSCLEAMVNDLSNMVVVPEFSYSEKFLGILMTLMMSEVKKSALAPAIEIILIDLCGKIASSLYSIKTSTLVVISDSTTVSEIIHHRRVLHRLIVDRRAQQYSSFADSNCASIVIKTASNILPICDKPRTSSSTGDQSVEFFDTEVRLQLLKYLSYLLLVLFGEEYFKAALGPDSRINYCDIALSSTIIAALDHFGDFVLNLLKSSKVKVRSKCIKLLADIADSNSKILKYNWVQKTINEMLDDPSPIVRDSVLELLKKFLKGHPNLVDDFQESLCSSLSDESVLVRKRVIKLLQLIYEWSTSMETRINIACKIILRLEEEEDATLDLAIKSTLTILWFVEPNIYKSEVDVAKIMVGVAKSSPKLHRLMVTYTRRDIIGGSVDGVKGRLKKILDATVDHVILNIDTEQHDSAKDLLKLVALFAESDGSLLTQQHLVLIQSFLTEEGSSSDSISFPTLQIFNSTIPTIRALGASFVENTMTYLLNGITKFSKRELHEAVPCAWFLCKSSGNTSKLSSAAISTMRMVYPFIDSSNTSDKAILNIKLVKLLELLGCFGAYCDFEVDRHIFMKSSLGLKENESIVSLITKFLLIFCDPHYATEIRITAISNLIHVCASHPKLLVSPAILRVLDTELGINNCITQNVVINGIIRFLNKQEDELLKRAGNNETVASNSKLDKHAFVGEGKSYVSDGICTAIVQRFLPKVLDLCLQNSDTSNSPVRFLTLVVKLGFANPKVCLPYILALQSSSDGYIKRTAVQLHTKLFDRFESLTESSYPEGVRLAVDYRRRISDNIFSERFFLKLIYSVVNKTLNSRRKFVQALAKLLTIGTYKSLDDAITKRDGCLFIVLNLEEISFMTLEEVAILMSSLSNTLSRDAMDLSEAVATLGTRADLKTIQIHCVNCQISLMFLLLWDYFMGKYDLQLEDIVSFIPGKASLEMRQAPRVRLELKLDFDFLIINMDLQSRGAIFALFTRFTTSMLEYSM